MVTSTAARKAKPHQKYYLASGDHVPGVTTILGVINKPALVPWANKLGLQGVQSSERLAYLADAGALAHRLIESSLTGITAVIGDCTPDQVQLAQNALRSFQAWARDKAIETRQTELPLVSEAHGFGGTCDWYGCIDGRPTLIDFKTGSAIYDDQPLSARGVFLSAP